MRTCWRHAGARLLINDLGVALDGSGGSEAPALEAVEDIRKAGGHAIADASDIATEGGAQGVVEACLARLGKG